MDIQASQRYQTHWTHSSESLFTVRVRPDGEFEFEGLNPAHERRTGLSSRELAGKTPHQCLAPEVADAIVARYRACLQSRRTTRYLETLDLPGGFRHWETTLVPVRDPQGRVALLLGSARDLTERDNLQVALSRSEARFQLLAETVPDIVFVLNESGRLEYLSARFYEFTGARPRSRPSIASHLHPADRDLVRRWRGQGAQRSLFDTEVRMKGRDGQYRWFLIRASRLDSVPGGQWFGVATDIHEVKAAARIQEDLNDRLNGILSSISDCFFTTGRDWKITGVNQQAAEWFRRSADELIGTDLRDELPVNRPVEAAVRRAMESGTRAHFEAPSPIRPGRVIEVHVYPSTDGASVFFHDITEAHTARKNLKSAQDLLRLTVDSLSAHVAILDAGGVVTEANRAWRDYAATNGLPLHCEVGVNCLQSCGASDATEKRSAAGSLRDVLGGRSEGFTHLYRSDRDPVRWFHMVARGFEHEGERRAVVAFEDVTSLTVAQQALVESAERHLVLQEEDRRRIAADLHDSTGQHLVALSLTTARLKAMLPQTKDALELFDDLQASLDAAQREVRVYSYLLHPPYLATDGLVLSIRNFLRGFARRSGLRIVEHIDEGADKADMSARRAVFRIVQEALSNVQRHSGATRISVELEATDSLRLRIEDDGKGLSPQGPDGPAIGVGISGMHERVRELGGRITFDQHGAGLVIEAEIPFSLDLDATPTG